MVISAHVEGGNLPKPLHDIKAVLEVILVLRSIGENLSLMSFVLLKVNSSMSFEMDSFLSVCRCFFDIIKILYLLSF